MEGSIEWKELLPLLSILRWIFGAIAAMVVSVVGGVVWVVWAGGRWSQKIEDGLEHLGLRFSKMQQDNDEVHVRLEQEVRDAKCFAEKQREDRIQ